MNSGQRPDEERATEHTVQDALRQYMQQAPLPFAITRGASHTLVYGNSAFRRLVGVANNGPLGTGIARVFPESDRHALIGLLDRAFRDGIELHDKRMEATDGRANAWHLSVWPVISDDRLTEALGIEIRESNPADAGLDLQRQVAERMLLGALRERGFAEDAEAARRRAAFLAEAGRLLAESVNEAGTFAALAKLALPTLGAWCIMDILNNDGKIQRLGIYHPDPEKQKLASELESTWLPQDDDSFGAPAMLRDSRPHAITKDIEFTIEATARTPDQLRILRQLGIGTLLTVPLIARRKLLGAVTFVSAQRGYTYSPEEMQLAEDLAARGAVALENAQAYDLALVLQHTAETANRAKTVFLGAMSHELRTPLNAIGGYIDLLDMGLRGPVTEQQHADFARVRTSQQHLALLITEILNFARVGSGHVTYAVTDVTAGDVMRRAVELIEPLFGQKGIVFEGISGDLSAVARADPDRVTQILVNLLSNAIKFTGAGGRVGGVCGSTADTVTLGIKDTGIGIAADKHEAIFEPFIQLKEGLADRESGVGLGLAISRDLARAMNGDLTVESKEAKGARFTLSLPRAGAQKKS